MTFERIKNIVLFTGLFLVSAEAAKSDRLNAAAFYDIEIAKSEAKRFTERSRQHAKALGELKTKTEKLKGLCQHTFTPEECANGKTLVANAIEVRRDAVVYENTLAAIMRFYAKLMSLNLNPSDEVKARFLIQVECGSFLGIKRHPEIESMAAKLEETLNRFPNLRQQLKVPTASEKCKSHAKDIIQFLADRRDPKIARFFEAITISEVDAKTALMGAKADARLKEENANKKDAQEDKDKLLEYYVSIGAA